MNFRQTCSRLHIGQKEIVVSLIFIIASLWTSSHGFGSEADTVVVQGLPPVAGGGLYGGNAAPLAPSPLIKLPPGAVIPKGWLRNQLELDAEGIPGRLDEISRFLQYGDGNGWVNPKSDAGEEVGYWLRGYGDLGYVLQDPRIIANSKKWIDAILATAQPDGYFGPDGRKPETVNGVYNPKDPWAQELMLSALCSYYDYSGDPRVLQVMGNYFKWVGTQPDPYFKSGWGALRWSDPLFAIYWLYDQTKDASLLAIATRIQNSSLNYVTDLGNGHNVNWTQGFRQPAEYSMQTNDSNLRDTSEKNYEKVMSVYGQFPGGGLAGDETWRNGYVDPRQGMETCGFVEYMRSFEILQRITSDPRWADRCEEIAFNSLPATVTPNHRALHYITSANSIDLHHSSNQLGQFSNGPFPMQSYEPSPHNYRCCTHNYGMGWPYFTESLWGATGDDGLCAAMYSPCEVTAKVGDGTAVTISEETDYPFDGTIKFTIHTPKDLSFPIYFRIPGWATTAQFQKNGQDMNVTATPLSYVKMVDTWKQGDVITLRLPMSVRVQSWAGNRGSISIYYGPLDFSLDIKEQWKPYVPEKYDKPNWGGYEISPLSAWDYGLVPPNGNNPGDFKVERKPGPLADQPFAHDTVPLIITAQARRIDQWRADSDKIVGPLQDSPAQSTEPVETVALIPAGAARLRITSFPTVSSGPDAHPWIPAPANLARITASYSEWPFFPGSLIYGQEPRSSHDLSLPHFTWWSHRGTSEWIQFRFPGPVTITGVAPYWFIDRADGHDYPHTLGYHAENASAAPQSWTVQYYDGKGWESVNTNDSFGTAPDVYNRVNFKAVTAYSVRVIAQLAKDATASLYAVKIYDGDTQLVPTVDAIAANLIEAGATAASSQPVPERMYRASDLKLSDSSPVTTWTDTSSGGTDATLPRDRVQPPHFSQHGINQLPSLHFEGDQKEGLAFPRPNADDFTIAIVFQSTKGEGGGKSFTAGSALLQGYGHGGDNDFGVSLNSDGEVLAGTGNPDVSLASHPHLNDGRPHLVVFKRVKANGDLTLFVDGTQVDQAYSSNFASLTSSDQLGIGATPRGDAPFTGDIGDIYYYSYPLSDSDLQSLEHALMSKWGIH